MANVSILPFGGVPSLEVAYVSGVNPMSNMYTTERMEEVTRFLLYPTITSIIRGLAVPVLRSNTGRSRGWEREGGSCDGRFVGQSGSSGPFPADHSLPRP